ncbi:hypothetical protein BOTCAL_0102g00050 [Botryotinia calthae]|uniref:Mediator of RNA polymerase II transcription subunit 22 n=1 Tax=Botryotinia calthae TaxID=38488 RepID=A0A4Y8D8L7_9HELO|nr:hypothetical protein BOTCAL_0102g00050 [Botryotinia calthae]
MAGDGDLWNSSRVEAMGTVSGNSVETSDSTRVNEDTVIDSSAPSRPGLTSRAISSDFIRIDAANVANFLVPPGSEHMSGAPASNPISHPTRINDSSVTDSLKSTVPENNSRVPSSDFVINHWPVSESSMVQSIEAVATEPMPSIPGPEAVAPYSSGHQLGIIPLQPIGALTHGLDLPPQPIEATGENTSSTRLSYYGVDMHTLLVDSTGGNTSTSRLTHDGVGIHLQPPIEFTSEIITNPSLLNEDAANESLGFVESVFNNNMLHQGSASLGLPNEVTVANVLIFDNGMLHRGGSSAQMIQNNLHIEDSSTFENISIPDLLNEVTATAKPISNSGTLGQDDPYVQVVQNDVSLENLLGDGNDSRLSLLDAFAANQFPEFPDLVFDNGMLHQDDPRPNLPHEVTAITEPVPKKKAASITGLIAKNEAISVTEPVAEDERPSQNDLVHKHEPVHNDDLADDPAVLRASKADKLTDRQERAIAALLIRFQNLVKLAALPTEDAFTKETAAAEGLRMEVESNALTSAAEDLLKLTRELKEFWIFGSLRGIGEGEGDGEMETDSKKVAELIEKQLEKKHEQEKSKA